MYTPYFLRNDEFGKMALQLFDLKTLTVPWARINFRTALLSFYPVFFCVLNLFFILSLIGFFFFGGTGRATQANLYILLLATALWLCNAGFSIIASSIVLRYQVFVMIVQFVFGLVMVELILSDSRNKPLKKPLRAS
jgi:hypothetical protein